MKLIKKGLFFLIFCFICEEVLAAVFTVNPGDRSQQYLGIVFGGSVGAINLGGNVNNNTLSLMFERFNFIIVSVGAIVLSYIGIASTINTAREGEALGKKMSLWVPLRAFAGMLLMVPGPTTGYSVVQMTVLWVVLNGIGAANSVWSVVLEQLSKNINAVGGLAITLSPSDLSGTTQAVLNASTCMNALNAMQAELSTPNSPFTNFGSVRIYKAIQSPTPVPGSTGSTAPGQISQSAVIRIGLQGAQPPFDDLCGFFTVTANISQNDPLNNFNYATLSQRLDIKVQALDAMFDAVAPATQLLASNITGGAYIKPASGYVAQAGMAYINKISLLATGLKTAPSAGSQSWETGTAPINPLTSAYQTLLSYGWIHAGSYYYSMVQASSAATDPETMPGSAKFPMASLVPIQTTLNPANNMPMGGTGWPTTDQNFNTALTSLLTAPGQTTKLKTALDHSTSYWASDQQSAPPAAQGIVVSSPSTGNQYMDTIVQGIATRIQDPILNYIQSIGGGGSSSSASSVIANTFTNFGNMFGINTSAVTSQTEPPAPKDPLLAIGKFGTTLMLAGETSAFIALIASFILSIALSAGSAASPIAWAINLLLVQVLPLIYGVSVLLWTAGATLGVYIPLVPYLIFTTSAFAWIIAVIEAVVGAPLIALGLIHPSGEELGKIGSALHILANIFLRPTLMIFGFVLGASLLRAGIALINFGFIPALKQGTVPSIFSIIAVLTMYIFLIMAIVNKSFSLIYMLPNQIMRWMGGQAETSHDAEGMMKETKSGFDTGAKYGQDALNTAHKKATDHAESKAAQKKPGSELPTPHQ